MKKILLIVVGILVLLVAGVLIIGLLTPADHQASRTLRLKQSPETVWAAINDHANEPSWRDDVASVTSAGEQNGQPVWQENYKDGNTLQLMTTESRQPNRMVREIAEEGPFSGRWEIDIQPIAGGSSVKITEIGKVSNPFFRVVSKYILGHTHQMEKYLTSLAKKFGEQPDIVH
ncbi:MAG TPA: SRPBCC family protein [Pyrinomonadaceae bacterium]|nr:SRPBCC family protein [Pyrinomonadaceae bacterium]